MMSLILLRHITIFLAISIVVLLIPGLLLPLWIHEAKRIANDAELMFHETCRGTPNVIENTAAYLAPLDVSARNLVKIIGSSINSENIHTFRDLRSKVAPALFQALTTIPHVSQISYLSLNGLFFSYYIKGDQILALYTNASSGNSSTRTNNTYYTQPVKNDSGQLFGEAVEFPPPALLNKSWSEEAMNSTNWPTLVGADWSNKDLLILKSIRISGNAAISIGYPVKSFTDFLTKMKCTNGTVYLATADGGVIITQGIPNTRIILNKNSAFFELLDANGAHIGQVGNISCEPKESMFTASVANIQGMKFTTYCSPLEIMGVQMIYVLAIPHDGHGSLIYKDIRLAIALLLLVIAATTVSFFSSIYLTIKAAQREMYLQSMLIRQMESTQQAERKSMNKSLAFASASHDIRTSLAGIAGLIDLCRNEVVHSSELKTNLRLMEACIEDLLGILNTILDTSKIEAGKMQLKEVEFDLDQLLEDVVDLYYPVGMKKGVDVILDSCDGSITKYRHVKGDAGRVKQILGNLLSNAVKFTSEGHVSVRAWAKKPRFAHQMLASTRNDSVKFSSCFSFGNDDTDHNDINEMNTTLQDPNCLEFVFEVSDTGKGIPKEKQKSVFENYVQVKEMATGQDGTGLGLGIVQSLVRLMGGEIRIVEKDIGEKGTCFRFNIFLVISCQQISARGSAREDTESRQGFLPSDSHQHRGLATRVHGPNIEGSMAVLLIKSDERGKILQKFMETLGLKVVVTGQHEQLCDILKKIKQKQILSRYSYSGASDANSRSSDRWRPSSRSSSTKSKEMPLSSLDGADDNVLPPTRRATAKRSLNYVLIIIDTSAGSFREISRAVAEFRKDLSTIVTRLVWVDTPGGTLGRHFQGLSEEKLPSTDMILSKPLHGSRLYQVVGLLPEFGGALPTLQSKVSSESKDKACSSSTSRNPKSQGTRCITGGTTAQEKEIEELDEQLSGKSLFSAKKVLVAEDNPVQLRIASSVLSQMGAEVYCCRNGIEALEMVCKGLSDQRRAGQHGASYTLPYDYIMMDCQMPEMDGFEATKGIRREEGHYGIHIPIIALTAGDETTSVYQAGMDFHINKPLTREKLKEATLKMRNQNQSRSP